MSDAVAAGSERAGGRGRGRGRARGFRTLGSVVLPAASVRALAGVLLAGAVGMPWLAEWQGVVAQPEGQVVVEDAGAVELVRVPGGRFRMGSEAGDDDEKPVHEAEVAAFEVCRTEVTQGQWKAVMGTEPFDCAYGCGDEYPAQNVSWNDAVAFMNRLTERENALRGAGERSMTVCYEKEGESWVWRDTSCTGYRLPTETEWEYAARADTTTKYGFGDDVKILVEHAWRDGDSGNASHPVRQKKMNPWGLYDVHGNVWEWVWDWHDDRYLSGATPEMYAGSQSGEYRVVRGGSFGDFARSLRSASRNWDPPSLRSRFNGFRCVRGLSLPEPPSTP